jgi:hypothetical protein
MYSLSIMREKRVYSFSILREEQVCSFGIKPKGTNVQLVYMMQSFAYTLIYASNILKINKYFHLFERINKV